MFCGRVRSFISAYLDGQLNQETAIQVEKHLQSCSRCYTEYEGLRSTKNLLGSMAKKHAVVISAEHTLAYVKRQNSSLCSNTTNRISSLLNISPYQAVGLGFSLSIISTFLYLHVNYVPEQAAPIRLSSMMMSEMQSKAVHPLSSLDAPEGYSLTSIQDNAKDPVALQNLDHEAISWQQSPSFIFRINQPVWSYKSHR